MNGGDVGSRPGTLVALARLARGEAATIERLGGRPETMLHLLELGLCPGERVRLMRSAPGGDPVELEIMGYRLAIRLAEADAILVSREGAGSDAG